MDLCVFWAKKNTAWGIFSGIPGIQHDVIIGLTQEHLERFGCQVLGTLAFVAPEAWTRSSNFLGTPFCWFQQCSLSHFGRFWKSSAVCWKIFGRFWTRFKDPPLWKSFISDPGGPGVRIPSFSYVQPGSYFGPLRPVCSDSGTSKPRPHPHWVAQFLSHSDLALWDYVGLFFLGNRKIPWWKTLNLPHFLKGDFAVLIFRHIHIVLVSYIPLSQKLKPIESLLNPNMSHG